ncbi:MAG: amidotransferase [Spirochaetia bacterium]|nr:amidotransferase [Spirochaetia bacterium]
MRIRVFQHVPFEGPAGIADWAARRSHRIDNTRLFESHELPAISDFDFLVVMGGPMGANDDSKFTWMSGEKKIIGEAIASGKKVLGVCLGAQLIASVLGARVYPNAHKEIGWYQVEKVSESPLTAHFSKMENVFHWHGDTFDLPRSAQRLLSSKACTNQAFSFQKNVLALQFHLEMGASSIEDICLHCADELTEGTWIQSEKSILEGRSGIHRNLALLEGLLDRFTEASSGPLEKLHFSRTPRRPERRREAR